MLNFFSRLRKYSWPIYGSEHKKFIPMMLIFMIISFNYNLLKAAKDALIVTAPDSGAEALPCIKFLVLASAVFMAYFFTYLSHRFSREKVFYFMVSIFIGFFALFALLFPLREQIHPSSHFSEQLMAILPQGLRGFVAVLRNWTLVSYYIMSELWGTAILSVLFWGFANDVTSVDQAKRFYGLFAVGANISCAFAGVAARIFTNNTLYAFLPSSLSSWEQCVLFLNMTIVLAGLIIMLIYRYLYRQTTIQQMIAPITVPHAKKEEKDEKKPSFKESFLYLIRSKYLIYIALIVLTYNVTINLTEVIWKHQLRQLFSNPNDYTNYMGQVMTATGIVATFFALFISGNLLRKFNWVITALSTPVMVLVFGILFFSSFGFDLKLFGFLSFVVGMTPLALNVFLGSVQNVLARASKYTLFDSSKEIAFIPLSRESKLKGKAAIDGVGSRLGKSGGAVVYQTLLFFIPSLTALAPYIAFIFLIVVAIWIFSVVALGKKFNELTKVKEAPTKEQSSAKESSLTSV